MRAAKALAGALLAALIAALAPVTAQAAGDRCKGQGTPLKAAAIPEAERSLLCLLNVYRAANGLDPLAHDPQLRQAARDHSEDMVARGYFDHDAPPPNESTPRERAAAAGYPTGQAFIGENIYAAGSFTPLRAFEGWRESPGHNTNMLRPIWRNVGSGIAVGFPANARQAVAASNPGTATHLFGSAATGADDTAIDLLVPAECAKAKQAKRKAAQKLKQLKRKLGKASGKGKRKLRRKVAAASKRLKKAKATAQAACNPDSF